MKYSDTSEASIHKRFKSFCKNSILETSQQPYRQSVRNLKNSLGTKFSRINIAESMLNRQEKQEVAISAHKKNCSEFVDNSHFKEHSECKEYSRSSKFRPCSKVCCPKKETEKGLGRPNNNELMTPAQALRLHRKELTSYEQGEILQYKEIYFIGLKHNKIKPNINRNFNHGYDDDKGNYLTVVGDQIAFRFEILASLGSGSFGKVIRVLDHKTQTQFAVKIIKNIGKLHHQAAVEVKILRILKHHPNVIEIIDCFHFRHHTCILFELMELSLYVFIQKKERLPLKIIAKIAAQLLNALKTQHELKLIHCDLKPENIMIGKNSEVKVIDYGTACFQDKQIYACIQTRYYRAPEIILGIEYTTMIDMWSFGCILAEMYTGKPLFPGECETEQLLCMMEVLDLPPPSLLSQGNKSHLFFHENAPVSYSGKNGKKRIPGTRNINQVLYQADPLFIDLVRSCLEWNCRRRITPEQAIEHQWITENLKKNKCHNNL